MAGNDNSGRRKTLDLTDEKTLGELMVFGRVAATQKEMGDYWGLTETTIGNYMREEDSLFSLIYNKAKAETHKSIRSKQVQKALKGDNTMLMWVGKNMLGQTDKTAVDHTTNGKTINACLNLTPLPDAND